MRTNPHPATLTPEEMFDAFVNGRLAKDEWTHEAHLITCWIALQERSANETLGLLREAIQTHNCGIGIRNTETGGYHETLTVYYVTAVDQAAAPTLDDLFAEPSCSRTAPLAHWTKAELFSTAARLDWLEPTLAPLPWAPTRPGA